MRFRGYLTVELYRLQSVTIPVDSGSSGCLWATGRPLVAQSAEPCSAGTNGDKGLPLY